MLLILRKTAFWSKNIEKNLELSHCFSHPPLPQGFSKWWCHGSTSRSCAFLPTQVLIQDGGFQVVIDLLCSSCFSLVFGLSTRTWKTSYGIFRGNLSFADIFDVCYSFFHREFFHFRRWFEVLELKEKLDILESGLRSSYTSLSLTVRHISWISKGFIQRSNYIR